MQEVASRELVVATLKLLPHSLSWGHGPSLRAFWGLCYCSLESSIPWWLPDGELHNVSALYRARLGFKWA